MNKYLQLVSVGMPTYNRPEGLRKALECIMKQTYKNLEIIVSDNCSLNVEVANIFLEFAEKDKRIKFFHQKRNEGSLFNFDFVLSKATGEYFMWAADDDEWEPLFIEMCLSELNKAGKKYVASIMEAQYFGTSKFDFFPEGEPFYNFYSENTEERLAHILKYNYGNLYYSLFRRSVLFKNGKSIININSKSMNEIALFLSVASCGNWKVISKVGFYKHTNIVTYKQAKWEKVGGWRPGSLNLFYFLSLPSLWKYHKVTLKEIKIEISSLGVDVTHLKKMAKKIIWRHFYYFIVRHKPPYYKNKMK